MMSRLLLRLALGIALAVISACSFAFKGLGVIAPRRHPGPQHVDAACAGAALGAAAHHHFTNSISQRQRRGCAHKRYGHVATDAVPHVSYDNPRVIVPE